MVQPADDVQPGRAAALGFAGTVKDLLVRHYVALLALQVGPKRAKDAAIDADVGRIQVRVDVVVRSVAVLALANHIREFAEREEIDLLFEEEAVIEREPPAGFSFGADGMDGGHAIASESSGQFSLI